MREEVLFRDRLEEHFGERSRGFSAHLVSMFREFWADGVEVGKQWPRAYEGSREIKIMSHFCDNSARFSAHLKGLFCALWRDALDYGKGEMCFHCGSREGVEMESARTAYEPTDDDPDPNADIPYCRVCAGKHHEYWDEMWDEYNRGRL